MQEDLGRGVQRGKEDAQQLKDRAKQDGPSTVAGGATGSPAA